MAKDVIKFDGKVSEVLPGNQFRVELDNGVNVHCHLSGKMRLNRIMIVVGDRVEVEISPYDISKGRISYRR
jgi:translation initiation factor IF-1